MDIKKVILIVAVVVVAVAALGGYFLFSTPTVDMNQTTIVLSKSAYMNVPIQDNASSNADKDGIFHYVDNENGINVTSCNSNISKKSRRAMLLCMKKMVLIQYLSKISSTTTLSCCSLQTRIF